LAGFSVRLSEITIVVEWENPRDVDSEWTDRAMRALADELAREGASAENRPTVLYLFDTLALDDTSVRDSILRSAPDLEDLATVKVIPTEGLAYYQLKNQGIALTTTPYVVLLDSDASPQPGWLAGLLRPFERPEIMAVSGVTSLETHNAVSRSMALIWIFDLPSEHERLRGQINIHANNCAFRTDFFQKNPFPNTPAFKKQCGLWLADIVERGFGFERTPEAYCRHAPHSGMRFVVWRAIQSGFDRDAKAKLQGQGRFARVARGLRVWIKKTGRSTGRILAHHSEVDMPAYQVPISLVVAWTYVLSIASAQILSATIDGVPDSFRLRWADSS